MSAATATALPPEVLVPLDPRPVKGRVGAMQAYLIAAARTASAAGLSTPAPAAPIPAARGDQTRSTGTPTRRRLLTRAAA